MTVRINAAKQRTHLISRFLKRSHAVRVRVDNLSFSPFLSVSYDECKATSDWLLSNTQVRPTVGIVCGSGMGGLAEMLKDPQVFKYADIPNFPRSTGEHSLSTKQLLMSACMNKIP